MNKLVLTGIILITAPLILSYRYLYKAYFLFFGKAGQGLETETLRGEIFGSLYGIIGWPLLGFVGFIVLAMCLDGMKYRPRWFFWTFSIQGLRQKGEEEIDGKESFHCNNQA